MATTQATLTPASDQTPAVARIPERELSGAQWVSRFPTSASVSDLAEPFQSNVASFFNAISVAGGATRVSATYRPPERAYLMHYASSLSRGTVSAESIPAMTGVNIEWVHPTATESKTAASAMADAYGIVYPPALVSNHSRRTAIDVTITGMIGRVILDGAGTRVTINSLSDLNAVGVSYGVIKLVSDPPHWSEDGH